MKNAICYRINATGREYLAYYTYKDDEAAKNEAAELNMAKPEKLWNGEPAHCDERTYFVNKQKEMF